MSSASEITDECADQAALIDTLVLIEAFVFGGEEGPLYVLRNIGKRHPPSSLAFFEDFREALPVAIEHDARPRKREALELGVVGKVSHSLVVEVDSIAE